ncbi:hypothetical protein [Helcococcus bovis]|uniref:hypothetical protein n=1 Tax=Helcococcus bovis TaxID=3153252 RepID=UPI0038BC692C
MKIIDSLKAIVDEINLEIENEKLKNNKTYTKKIKKNGQTKSKNTLSKKASTFEEKYGNREYFKDNLYYYSDEGESELSDTVKDYDDYLENFKAINNKDNKVESPLSKELRKRNSARKSFIHSIIFERKI